VILTRVGAACAALAASFAIPLSVRADPPQAAAAGFLLPAGTVLTIVVDQQLDSAVIEPGTIVRAHLRDPIVVRGKTLAPAGAQVQLIVSATRRSSEGVSGEIMLRVEPLQLSDGLNLPMRLVYPVLSPLLIAANTTDITLPQHAKNEQIKRGEDLIVPRGTMLRAKTTVTVDATNPQQDVLVAPPPYTISTEKPYSAFTPIPLATYNPRPTPPPRNRRGRGRGGPTPSPSPSPSVTASPSASAISTASPSASPTTTATPLP
jgi:hypothetical protein